MNLFSYMLRTPSGLCSRGSFVLHNPLYFHSLKPRYGKIQLVPLSLSTPGFDFLRLSTDMPKRRATDTHVSSLVARYTSNPSAGSLPCHTRNHLNAGSGSRNQNRGARSEIMFRDSRIKFPGLRRQWSCCRMRVDIMYRLSLSHTFRPCSGLFLPGLHKFSFTLAVGESFPSGLKSTG